MGATSSSLVAICVTILASLIFLLGLRIFHSRESVPHAPTAQEPVIIDHDGAHPIAVIIPCYKEGDTVSKTVAHLFETCALSSKLGKPCVRVVQAGGDDDNSSDNGEESALTKMSKTHPELTVESFSYPSRGEQQNFGARSTTQPVLLFLHADTLLPTGWDALILQQLNREATRRRPTIGAFTLSLPKPISPSLRVMLWGANIRAKYGWLPYGDQAYFLRRSTFESVGGFPSVPIMEDLGLLTNIAKARGQVVVDARPVLTSPRRWNKNGVVWNTMLNQVFILAWKCGATPEQIYKWYYGREAQPRPT